MFGQASPHPRGYGMFVRVLGRYVRDLKAITLEEAVRKMSAFPAQRIGGWTTATSRRASPFARPSGGSASDVV